MPSVRRVSELVETTRPLVNRLAEDEELRQSLRAALGSAQRVYSGLGEEPSRKGAAVRLLSDPGIRGELQDAVSELRFATERARRPQRKSRHKTFLFLGAIAAFVLLNPVTGPRLPERISGVFSRRPQVELDYGD